MRDNDGGSEKVREETERRRDVRTYKEKYKTWRERGEIAIVGGRSKIKAREEERHVNRQ